MPEVIISDSSCLITLTNAGHLELLKHVYGHIMTTSMVAQEFGLPLPVWVVLKDPIDEKLVARFMDLVDGGEASAIALAMETERSVVILDDLAARRLATDLEIPHTGTIGVLLKAKTQGLIPTLEPVLSDLKRVGFRISAELEEKALRLAGER
jgi:predicted nucleic acid-binding protein